MVFLQEYNDLDECTIGRSRSDQTANDLLYILQFDPLKTEVKHVVPEHWGTRCRPMLTPILYTPPNRTNTHSGNPERVFVGYL